MWRSIRKRMRGGERSCTEDNKGAEREREREREMQMEYC